MVRSKDYCDICERKLGEEHPDAQIHTIKGRPCFPQLIWTYFREGLGCKKSPDTGEPAIGKYYAGLANRFEYCQKHGNEVNVLLKAYSLGDSKIKKMLDELIEEDRQAWDKKNENAQAEYDASLKEYEAQFKKSEIP